jgi:hypothetical protein
LGSDIIRIVSIATRLETSMPSARGAPYITISAGMPPIHLSISFSPSVFSSS